MRIVDKDAETGTAITHLDAGETIPAQCSNRKCRNVYTPEPNSQASVCPACGTFNRHVEGTWGERS